MSLKVSSAGIAEGFFGPAGSGQSRIQLRTWYHRGEKIAKLKLIQNELIFAT